MNPLDPFAEIAGWASEQPLPNSGPREPRSAEFDLVAFIAAHLKVRRGPIAWDGRGEKWELEVCPFNPDHTGGCAVVTKASDGPIGFRCQHNSCAGKGWREVRALFDGAEHVPPHGDDARFGDEWPEPEPLDALPGVEDFDEELLPASLRPLVVDIAERMQLPADLPAVGVVASLAGAVNRRALIQPKNHDTSWKVVPNIWAALIALSGIGKSPLLNLCIQVLLIIEQALRQEYEAAVQQHAAAEEEHKLERRAWEQEYIRAVKNHKVPPPKPEDLPPAPVRKRLLTNDATYEKLHELMSQNPAGILLVRDELSGWLSRLDREEYGAERGFALSAWNGDTPHTVDRIGRGSVHVPHCCLSVLGGFTPDRVRGYLARTPHNSPTADGLMQRFQLAVWPDISSDWVNVNRAPNAAAQQQAGAVYQRLTQLSHETPKLYRFAPDAQELFFSWLTDLERTIRSNKLPPALQSHLGKYRSLMPSLALLFELWDTIASGRETETVSLAHAQQAADWTVYLRSHAERIYSVEATPEFQAAALLGAKIRDHKADADGVLEVRRVYRHPWEGLSSPETVKAACDVLVDAGWLREIGGSTGGRPANRYQVNPKVLHE